MCIVLHAAWCLCVCSYSFRYVPVNDKTTAVKLSLLGWLTKYYKCVIVFINTPGVLPVNIKCSYIERSAVITFPLVKF